MTSEQSLAEIALRAARTGATAIAQVLAGQDLELTDKSGRRHDLVTAADRAAEAAIVAELRRLRPSDAILGEESGLHSGSSDVVWFVDPLDGTVNFVYGRHGWAVSVGAEIDDRPIAGAVFCPGDGRWACADEDGLRFGGFGDGPHPSRPPLPGAVGSEVEPADALISIGYPYPTGEREQVMAAMKMLVGRVRGVRLTGASASELLGLAGGDCDAFLSFNLPAWDTAGGLPIVLACGGFVRTTAYGDDLPVQVVTRSEVLADRLAEWLTSSG